MNCLYCNKIIIPHDSYDAKIRKFCSHTCCGKYNYSPRLIKNRHKQVIKIEKKCIVCNNLYFPKRKSNKNKYCSNKCKIKALINWNKSKEKKIYMTKINSKENCYNWKGGRIKSGKGYISIYLPEHPYAKRKYILEHRLVMEKELGRYLTPEEVVHHKNGIITDNRIENLELFNNDSKHITYHNKVRSSWIPMYKRKVELGQIHIPRSL